MTVQPGARMPDDRLRAAVAVANVPVLLLVLHHLTGQRRWLESPYQPRRSAGLDDNPTGRLPEEVQAEVREAAHDAIRAWLDGAPMSLPRPTPDHLVEMLSVSMGEPVGTEYGPMVAEELGIVPAPAPVAPDAGLDVLVIGTGVSGIVMATKLVEAGVACRLLERAGDVGGTWRDNHYPGCGVDTPSAIYSFSFADHPWSRYFAGRDEVQRYLSDVADRRGVRDLVDFDRAVESCVFDEGSERWSVTARSADGARHHYSAAVVVSAVGIFSEPSFPSVTGLTEFTGELLHTAQWRDEVSLQGRRVGVIGNGASAMQLVPAIADEVDHLTVFQRSPHWVAPHPQFLVEVPEVLRELGAVVPLYAQWTRVRAGWTFNDRNHAALQKDPQWDHPERAVNARNDEHRKFFTAYLDSVLGERDDLREALLPSYPPFGKRILLDNGWFATLTRADVSLETRPITQVEGNTVVVADERGEATRELDVLVCATGFSTVRFLSSLTVRGRGGQSLHDLWGPDDAQAYLGCAVPGFPNFFIMYGPNVQAGHGGSLVGLAEMQARYLVDLLRQLGQVRARSFEVRRDLWADYTAEVDAAHEAMVWTHPGMSTYYRNDRGRVVVPGPFRIIDMWHRMRHADLDDYLVGRGRAGLSRAAG